MTRPFKSGPFPFFASEPRRRKREAVPGLIGLLLAAGCASAPLRGAYPGPQPLPADVAAYYDYPERSGATAPAPFGSGGTIHVLSARQQWRELLVRFPLAASGFEPTEPVVEFEWFESTTPGRRAAILFNPILGGHYPLERGVCRFLAAHGFHVALVRRKTLKLSPEHEVGRIELLLRQGVIRMRQVVDWMAAHERVDAQRMGSFGISMGGIASVLAAAVEPRLRAHVVALAGGPIPDILARSPDRLLARPRAQYLTRNRMDLATLEERLRQEVRTDPIRFAPYVDARHLLVFIAVFDRTIGRANALRLRRALGTPRTVFLPFGHYSAYLALPYLKYESLRFFQDTLHVPQNR